MRFFNTIILLALIILLQIFLSTRKSKWCGLILPIISFLFALVIVPLNMMAPPTGIDFSYIVKMVMTFLVQVSLLKLACEGDNLLAQHYQLQCGFLQLCDKGKCPWCLSLLQDLSMYTPAPTKDS